MLWPLCCVFVILIQWDFAEFAAFSVLSLEVVAISLFSMAGSLGKKSLGFAT